MKRKIKRLIEILFIMSFIMTGCGIDSIFESKESMMAWIAAAIVTVLTGLFVLRDHDGD